MLTSNQPYQRVDDGIGAGLISGAVIGGATAGAFHSDMGRRVVKGTARNIKDVYKNKYTSLSDQAGMLPTDKQQKKLEKLDRRIATAASATQGVNKVHQKAFGSGKRKAVSYAGSVLAGATLGGLTDGLNG